MIGWLPNTFHIKRWWHCCGGGDGGGGNGVGVMVMVVVYFQILGSHLPLSRMTWDVTYLESGLFRSKAWPAVLTVKIDSFTNVFAQIAKCTFTIAKCIFADCCDGIIGRCRGMPRSNQQRDSDCQTNSCFHFFRAYLGRWLKKNLLWMKC